MKVVDTDKIEIEISVVGKIVVRRTLREGKSLKHASGVLGSNPHPRVSHSGGVGLSLTGTQRDANGKLTMANGDSLPAHITRIPPAWKDVQVSTNPKADLLVKGTDAKGRVQSVYSDNHSTRQAAIKFARINELRSKQAEIRKEIRTDMGSSNAKTRERATVLALVENTGMRVGSRDDTRAKVQAFGASTLEGRHVQKLNGGVRLKFIGKKGIARDVLVMDKALVGTLLQRKNKAGDSGKLFDATSGQVLTYSKSKDGGGFKTKDFRTAKGTETAINAMEGIKKPTNQKQYKVAVKQVATVVSKKLGNTPTIALQSYIDPVVFSKWRVK